MQWHEVCEHPSLQDLPFKIELNQWGQVVMRPAKTKHSALQTHILQILLRQPNGKVLPECPVRTKDNVKVADVAWLSIERYQKSILEVACSVAPEICVEVISASNTHAQMVKKMALYFDAGAEEAWLCSEEGGMRFFDRKGELEKSRIVPDFPIHVSID